jgi:dolichyl-phosphate-mannose-protein mannosyltransferase
MAGNKVAAAASGAQPLNIDTLRQRAAAADPSVTTPPAVVEIDNKKNAAKKSQSPSIWQLVEEWEVVWAPIIFTAVALFTRLYKIGLSNIVTWDEAQQVPPILPFHSICQ